MFFFVKMNVGLSGNNYSVATFSKSYLTDRNHHSKFYKTILNMSKLIKPADRYERTDSNYRNASLLMNAFSLLLH